VTSSGGNTLHSKVGAGGTITIFSSGVVNGPSVSAEAGTGTGSPLGNSAGIIDVSGTATQLFVQSGSYEESFAGSANIYGTVTNINGKGYGAYCDRGRAALVKIYSSGTVLNDVDLTGGDGNCTPSTAGILYVSGVIGNSAILVGSNKNVSSPWSVAGKGGEVRVYSTGEVKDISVNGGDAGVGTQEDGGNGGKITVEYGSKINTVTIDATSSTNPTVTGALNALGGTGNAPGVNGSAGTIIYQP
jgi:hypothetical protein